MLRRLQQLFQPWMLGRIRGLRIYLDWSLPMGLYFFCGLRPWAWLGFLILVGVHEAGHALLVRRLGFRVTGMHFHGFGGECVWSGDANARQRQVISWGGVVAQALLLAIAVLAEPLLRQVPDLQRSLVRMNVTMIAFNLVPIPPLDGATAWGLVFKRRKKAPVTMSPAQIQKVVEDALKKARATAE